MIYLDYAANTPADKNVLDCFMNTELSFTANPNSSHPLGKPHMKSLMILLLKLPDICTY